jgi:uncharacterized heparinase superfamily protein
MSSRKSDSAVQHLLQNLHAIARLKPRQAFYFALRRGLGQRRISPWQGAIVLRGIDSPTYPIIKNGHDSAAHFEFTFLNQLLRFTRDNMSWSPDEASRLWRYHLHYFDFLREDHYSLDDKFALIDDWIRQNPQGEQPAWEPYTTSLRIVNWCLLFLSLPRSTLRDHWLRSLYDQARWLERNLEWHILANHYFENIKAMVFAGAFFAEKKGGQWLRRFQRELIRQLAEQTLRDGGHYERSPHYHCVLLQGYLELYALHSANRQLLSTACSLALASAIQSGIAFLQSVRTPDNNIPLFNDSVALPRGALDTLLDGAAALGIESTQHQTTLIECDDSGYYGHKNADDYFLIDCGDIGPAYQPGHTHCDFLSFVLMIDRQWLVVDSGVYEYQPGLMRHYCRSTAAHNNVAVDDIEQSEIWAEFRVGRRALRNTAQITQQASLIRFEGAFAGFHRISGGIRHRRRVDIALTPSDAIAAVDIDDLIEGAGQHRLVSSIHLHPDITAIIDGAVISLQRDQTRVATLTPGADTTIAIAAAWHCPEFGKKIASQVIQISCTATLPHRMGYRIEIVR